MSAALNRIERAAAALKIYSWQAFFSATVDMRLWISVDARDDATALAKRVQKLVAGIRVMTKGLAGGRAIS